MPGSWAAPEPTSLMPFQQPLPPDGDAGQTEAALALSSRSERSCGAFPRSLCGTARGAPGSGASQERVFQLRRAHSHVYIKPGAAAREDCLAQPHLG